MHPDFALLVHCAHLSGTNGLNAPMMRCAPLSALVEDKDTLLSSPSL